MFLHYAQTCNLFVHFFMLSHAKKIAALQHSGEFHVVMT